MDAGAALLRCPTEDRLLQRTDQVEFAQIVAKPAEAIPLNSVPFHKTVGCRWIYGPAAHNAPTCNRKRLPGTSWCEQHYRRVFT